MTVSLVLSFVLWCAGSVQAQATQQTVSGVILRIDEAARKVIIKTADGVTHAIDVSTEAVVRATGKTEQGVEAALRAGAEGARAGSHAVVHVIDDGAGKTTAAMKVTGERVLKAIDVTIVKVDQVSHTVITRTADGVTGTFRLAREGVLTAVGAVDRSRKATVQTVDGAAKEIEGALHEGTTWVVHYSDEGADKVIHGLHRVG